MRKPTSGITPEGIPSIGLSALAALVFALLDMGFSAFIFLLLCAFSCHFFRDPERVPPADAAAAVSPADGKIIKISNMPDPFSGETRQCICIFMNVFNVHVNRVPVDCTIEDIHYIPGKFFNASFDKASKDNERCAYNLVDARGNPWSMVQIAGLIAQRIVCRVTPGEQIARGERFGMIKFGSRVDLYLPANYRPAVGTGDRVFAGQTIVAKPESDV